MNSRVLVALAVVAVLALGGGLLAYSQFGGSDPAPVSLEETLKSIQGSPTASGTTPRATPSVVSATMPAASPQAAAPAPGAATSGRWVLDAGSSFVGYRVVEELAQVGANTAVGRTSALTGDLTYDGRSVTALQVKADMRELKSDDSRRDNYLKRSSLESDRIPEASFVLAQPISISVAATEGATMQATASGDLTLHGVTKRVDIPVEGTLTSGRLVVVGSTSIAFADYAIQQPRAPLVLSIENQGVMELSLVFTPPAG